MPAPPLAHPDEAALDAMMLEHYPIPGVSRGTTCRQNQRNGLHMVPHLTVRRVDPQPLLERDGVEGGVHLGVVVEVDEDVEAAGLPAPHLVGPVVEGRVGVAAGVELGVAVQPDVGDAARHLVEHRPRAGGVGHHHPDVVGPQQLAELGRAEGGVPHLEHVAQRAVDRRGGVGGLLELVRVVVRSGVRRRGGGRARQQVEERGQAVGVEAQVGRQLPQDRARAARRATARPRRGRWREASRRR